MEKVMRLLLVLCMILMLADMSVAAEKNSLNKPIAVVYNPDYKFPSVLEGNEVTHEFIIKNKGKAPLMIEKVKTD